MIFSKAHLRGVTLVELLIVIAIIGILSAITIVSLVSTRTDREVQSAAQELAAHIRETQNYALTGKSTGLTTNNCRFQISGAGSTYTIQSQTRGAAACDGNSSQIATFTLPNGVTAAWGASISFSVPRAETELAGTVQITLSKGGSSAYVCISPSGKIEERTTACP